MSYNKRRRARLRLLVVGGLVALAATAMIVVWSEDSAGALEGRPGSGQEARVDPDATSAENRTDATEAASAGADVADAEPPDADPTDEGVEASSSTDAPARVAGPEDATVAGTATTALGGAATGSAPANGSSAVKVKVYFVQGEKLVAVTRTVTGTPRVGTAAVGLLLAGPSGAESSAGMTSEIPDGTRLRGLSVGNGLATVDLDAGFASGGGTSSMYLRLGQLVYTLTEFPTVDRVWLKVDGELLTSLGGEGLLLRQPLSRGD
ncbi:MAG: GerMN domain-containing protein [Armatimonadetes bacterium]|nr:GerMN domain-containing protein [Armatimonadota bacterium]